MFKRFSVIFAPVAILLALILGFIYYSDVKSSRVLIEAKETNHVNIQLNKITRDFEHIVSDLIYLAGQSNMTEAVTSKNSIDLHKLAKDYASFSSRKGIYDQIRLIDIHGQELVRVNHNNGAPVIVHDEKLQNKKDRYYFKNSIRLNAGDVFVSPFDLNVENGEIEVPLKPMIRFVSPVFDESGNKAGVIALNYLGSALLENLSTISSNALGQVSLLNSRGYWLLGPRSEDEWGFMFDDRKRRALIYTRPEVWGKIGASESGQFYATGGLYTFSTVYPLIEVQIASAKFFSESEIPPIPLNARDHHWKIVSFIPDNLLSQRQGILMSELGKLYGVLIFLLALGSLYIARAGVRRHEAEESLMRQFQKMESALSRAGEVLKLLSKEPRVAPNFVFSPTFRMSRTVGGGDTLRWLSFTSRYAAIYIHDVSGHDIEETLLNILTTAITDDHKLNPGRKSVSVPSVFLEEMNKRLLPFCESSGHYVTAAYLLMDYENRSMQLSLAGHPRPWLIIPGKEAIQVGESGFMMGMFDISPNSRDKYIDIAFRLNEGELLLIFTDGLMEQSDSNGVTFETKFKENIIPMLGGKNAGRAFAILEDEFKKHLGGMTPEDDVSFIFVGARPEGKYVSFEFIPSKELLGHLIDHAINVRKTLTKERVDAIPVRPEEKPVPPGCAVIKDLTESYTPIIKKLENAGWSDDKINKIELALMELTTNAIIHGNVYSDALSVTVSHILHDDVIEISVSDEGKGLKSNTLSQAVSDEDILKEHGKGFHIITQFADEVYFSASGNTIWLIFRK